MIYHDFLAGLVTFLQAHPYEIIVAQIRFDGILSGCAHATDEQLSAALARVLDGTDLHAAGRDDVENLSIHELRASGKRLVLMNSVPSYSTYTDAGNATLTGEPLIAEFEALDAAKQEGNAFTNIQCQATATNIRDAVIFSAIDAGSSNSCIMASKAVCDAKTLPWVREHAVEKLGAGKLVVMMNDFFDGATADVAVELSRRRLEAA